MTSGYIEGEIMVPIENLHPNSDNPRFEAGDVTELAASIREVGILQALSVRPSSTRGDGHYVIEDGLRRWTAAKLSQSEVPCRVYLLGLTEDSVKRVLVIGLVTSIHRADLNPIERAKAYGRLRTEMRMSLKVIAKTVGVSESTVSNSLALLELNEATQDRVRKGQVSVERARQAVRKKRARVRVQSGYKPSDVGWEPDHFTEKHFLSRKAKTMCDARDHSNRRRRGGACDYCWETVIRQDEAKVQQASFREAGFDVPFQEPANGLFQNARSERGRT